MTLALNDRVKETTTVTGTGTATLLGATTGFQPFAVIGNANTTYYCIADQGGANWEVGIGTYTASGTTLARTTVLASSNAGALVVFTTGVKDVFVTYPSEKGVWYDESGNVLFTGTTTAANLAYTGTLTGSTGILNIGSGQVYKDASGNVGIGTTAPNRVLEIAGTAGSVLGLSNKTQLGTNVLYGRIALYSSYYGATYIDYGGEIRSYSKTGVDTSDLRFYTSNGVASSSEAMCIDSSGNVGIGVTPIAKLDVVGSQWIRGAAAAGAILVTTADPTSGTNGVSLAASFATGSYGPLKFFTSNAEAMRIDSSGNVLVGKSTGSTSTAGNQFGLTSTSGYNESVSTNAGGTLALWYMNRHSSAGSIIDFRQNLVTVGSITVTSSATLYNVTSDQRLKTDLGIVTETNIIDDTVIHDFTWKSNDTQSRGVFAQEAVKVNPSAVSVGDDGEEVIKQWQVDYSKYVPDLIVHAQQLNKQVQEQQNLIEALTARLTALEAK